MRSILIPTIGPPSEYNLDDKRTIEDARKVLNGWVEQVRINPVMSEYLGVDRSTICMLVDEEGLYKPYLENPIAALLYNTFGVIKGDALLVGMVGGGTPDERWGDLPRNVTVGKLMTLMGDDPKSDPGAFL